MKSIRKLLSLAFFSVLLIMPIFSIKAEGIPQEGDYLPPYQEETALFSVGAKKLPYQLSEEAQLGSVLHFMANDIEVLKQKTEILNDDIYRQNQEIGALKAWNIILSMLVVILLAIVLFRAKKK